MLVELRKCRSSEALLDGLSQRGTGQQLPRLIVVLTSCAHVHAPIHAQYPLLHSDSGSQLHWAKERNRACGTQTWSCSITRIRPVNRAYRKADSCPCSRLPHPIPSENLKTMKRCGMDLQQIAHAKRA